MKKFNLNLNQEKIMSKESSHFETVETLENHDENFSYWDASLKDTETVVNSGTGCCQEVPKDVETRLILGKRLTSAY